MKDEQLVEVCKFSGVTFLAFSALSLLVLEFLPDQNFLILVSIVTMVTSAFVACLASTYRLWLQFLASCKDKN